MLFLERSKEYMMKEGKKILLVFWAAVAARGMNMIMVVFPFCAVTFWFFVKAFKKFDSEFAKERKKFVEYLDTINDIETLKRIGEINMFGVREKWYPRYTDLIPYLEYKIQQTNDDNFKTYLIEYKKFIKHFLCTMPFIVLSVMIPLSCIISLFRK